MQQTQAKAAHGRMEEAARSTLGIELADKALGVGTARSGRAGVPGHQQMLLEKVQQLIIKEQQMAHQLAGQVPGISQDASPRQSTAQSLC
jgi:hypothetical protein